MKGQFFWLDYSQKDRWREWVSKLPKEKRDIYYDPDYPGLYVKDNIEANCYVYEREGNIYIYPFMKSSIPQSTGYFDIYTPYGYGGPISNTDDIVFLKLAYQCFYEEALKKNIVAELIKFHPLMRNYLPLAKIFQGRILKMCSTVYAEIDVDEDQRWKNIYTHANRKNINKAKRNNIEVKIGRDDKSWEALMSLYETTMRTNDAGTFYFFPSEYFENIKKRLMDDYVLVSCLYEGEVISVLLVLLGTVYAHCHLIGTAREFMTSGVNNLLHHELILWCKKNGYKKLHIGGGRSDNEDDSLLKFKQNFSDKVSDFYAGESVLNPAVYDELCAKWRIENPDKETSSRLLKYRF